MFKFVHVLAQLDVSHVVCTIIIKRKSLVLEMATRFIVNIFCFYHLSYVYSFSSYGWIRRARTNYLCREHVYFKITSVKNERISSSKNN